MTYLDARPIRTAQLNAPDRLASLRVRVARLIVCMVASLALAGGASAQSDFGTWLGANAMGSLPPSLNNARSSWRLAMDVQARFGDDASRFSQGILRSAIGYALSGGWTIWTGYAFIRVQPPYARTTTTEHRIWEQAIRSGTVGKTALSSRSRLEQRFVSTGSETGWRLREQVKVTRPLGSIWLAVVSDEYFLNLHSTNHGAAAGSDRNRFFIGPGVKLNKALHTEIGYLYQYTFVSNGPDKKDHIFAMNLFWSF
jgi:hypothetical protein